MSEYCEKGPERLHLPSEHQEKFTQNSTVMETIHRKDICTKIFNIFNPTSIGV